MADPIRLVSVAAVMFGVSLIPGPAAAYCLAAGLEVRKGFSVAAAAGVTAGKLAHLSVAALGAMWVVGLHGVVRVALLLGASAFMVTQGVRRWRQSESPAPSESCPRSSSRFLRGFIVSVLNPQSLASAIAVVPLFMGAEATIAEVATLLIVGTAAVFTAYIVCEGVAVLAARRLDTKSQVRVVGATYVVAAFGLVAIAAA